VAKKMKKKEKVILAYSGGLDTSVCIPWLKEKYDVDVIALTINVGQGDSSSKLKKKALATGASKIYIKDLQKEFVADYVWPSLRAGAVYESKYFLATALSRPLIAAAMVDTARKEGARYIAHGCTGKGNDQVRIEVGVNTLAPDLEVIAPLREWDLKSRDEEMDYAREKKIPVDATKKSPYSLDRNLWGVSIECGVLEDPDIEPPEDAYQLTTSPEKAPQKPQYLDIDFSKGVPVKLNGLQLSPVELVSRLEKIGAKHGIGRSDLTENRLVGIKSREIYEAPAACILHEAHRALEALVLDREVTHFKDLISLKYAEIVYYGLWFSPLKKALDGFVSETQQKVSGRVRIKLYKGNCQVVGRKSQFSLYKKELATYDKGDKFDQKLAEGFIKLWGLPYRGI